MPTVQRKANLGMAEPKAQMKSTERASGAYHPGTTT